MSSVLTHTNIHVVIRHIVEKQLRVNCNHNYGYILRSQQDHNKCHSVSFSIDLRPMPSSSTRLSVIENV